MAREHPHPVEPQSPAPGMLDGREFVELWIRLSQSDWTSVILVPADPSGSTAGMARALAETGQRLSFFQVTAITLNALEFGSALALADLAQHAERERRRPVAVNEAPPAEGDGARHPTTEAMVVSPPARLIISIPSVIGEPLGLPAAQQADAVVLVVRVGQTLTSHVKRTVQLIGRERVAGCVLVR
jgi:hypothetical protein